MPTRAPVAQGIEHRPPEPGAQVRILPGAREGMSKVAADISMSLDGFVTEPDPGGDNPLGDDPGRLHDWMFSEKTAADAEIVDEIYATTGAVLIGERMFEVGVEPWG